MKNSLTHTVRNNTRARIPRGLYEYASVCFVKDSDPSLFLATTETVPRGFSLVRQRSDCILHIVVVGTNAKPIERYFKLHFGSGFAVKYDDVSLTEIHFDED